MMPSSRRLSRKNCENNSLCKKITRSTNGSPTVVEPTDKLKGIAESEVTVARKDVLQVATKKTVRERVIKTILKTKERLAASSKQQQPRHQDGCTTASSGDFLSGMFTDEISIPVSFNNIISSNNSMKKQQQEKLRVRETTILGESPQEFLDNALTSRGYPVKRYNTLESAYYTTETTLLQQASYGVRLLEIIDESDEEALESCLLAGLHSNPCDEYGESALHRICRHGNMALLDILLDTDCSVQCADDFGRTPLHEACRCESLCFPVVETLMMQDIHLIYMADASGQLPFECINPEHWYDWILFLQPRIDRYWPPLYRDKSTSCTSKDGHKNMSTSSSQPPLTLLRPGSRPAADPDCPLTTELAWMLASGVIEPKEAMSFMDESVLQRYLPTINQRLNDMAAEEERKEKLQRRIKTASFGIVDNIDDDLTV